MAKTHQKIPQPIERKRRSKWNAIYSVANKLQAYTTRKENLEKLFLVEKLVRRN